MEILSHSEQETEALGASLAQRLGPGDVVAYRGDLGAGKTAFTRGLARGLGCTGRVTSPTFTIVNEYEGQLPLFHFDLYRLGDEEEKTRCLSFDGLVINLDSYELEVRGKRVDTPPKELELLYHLASAPNRVFTRNQLLDEVWGFDYFGDSRTVDVHIKRLREKLEGVSDQWSLKTVWGVGYKFELHND